MLKVVFSLISNINQSACINLDWVFNSKSELTEWLYKRRWEFPINKKTIPMLTLFVCQVIPRTWLSDSANLSMSIFRLMTSPTTYPMSLSELRSSQLTSAVRLGWLGKATMYSILPPDGSVGLLGILSVYGPTARNCATFWNVKQRYGKWLNWYCAYDVGLSNGEHTSILHLYHDITIEAACRQRHAVNPRTQEHSGDKLSSL